MQQVHENQSPLMASSTTTMESKQDQNHNQAQAAAAAAALRCPRCDSANTKFCYYNNYSLSQPRHFCKACKRYWTRGGTLRNVPVGGGCRKNKRGGLKRVPASTNPAPPSSTATLPAVGENPSGGGGRHQFQLIEQMNPLFYTKQQSSSYDQLSSFATSGFHFPAAGSAFFGGGESPANNSSSADAILSPTMATLLASTLNNGGFKRQPDTISLDHHHYFNAVPAFDGLQMSSGVKAEQQPYQEWNFNGNPNNSGNQAALQEQIGSDPQSAYWNALWHDPGNIGPSVTSLI